MVCIAVKRVANPGKNPDTQSEPSPILDAWGLAYIGSSFGALH
jgi:hypothetical protein